jgi:hypothetical protein
MGLKKLIVPQISSVFTLCAAITTTVLYTAMAASLDDLLKPYSVNVISGVRLLAIVWIATASSMSATVLWLFSIFCCSGRT